MKVSPKNMDQNMMLDIYLLDVFPYNTILFQILLFFTEPKLC